MGIGAWTGARLESLSIQDGYHLIVGMLLPGLPGPPRPAGSLLPPLCLS
jgi:hypothetical protein